MILNHDISVALQTLGFFTLIWGIHKIMECIISSHLDYQELESLKEESEIGRRQDESSSVS